MRLGQSTEEKEEKKLEGEEKAEKESLGESSEGSGFKGWWRKQPQSTQRKLVLFAVFTLFILVILLGYGLRGKKEEPSKVQRSEKEKILKVDETLFEKGLYTKTQQEVTALKEQLEYVKSELTRLRDTSETRQVSSAVPEVDKEKSDLEKAGEGIPPSPEVRYPYPPPPQELAGATCQVPSFISEKPQLGEVGIYTNYQVIGDIAVVKGETKEKAQGEAAAEQEVKKKLKVYLPPSFMEATLLSGITAPATTEAKGNPLPVLLRIHDLAVLPNYVKANLKGCFVIGEAVGNLADERAHVRLVTLSCVAKNGSAVIDEKIKGFVVDEDGKVGLKGRVVSRMGATVARAALAGLFGGIGEGVSLSSFNVVTSPEGAGTFISKTDLENIAKVGLGKGISQATQELQKFYMELARQTVPVVEVGATKKVTLVISEGVELEIKDQKIFTGKEE